MGIVSMACNADVVQTSDSYHARRQTSPTHRRNSTVIVQVTSLHDGQVMISIAFAYPTTNPYPYPRLDSKARIGSFPFLPKLFNLPSRPEKGKEKRLANFLCKFYANILCLLCQPSYGSYLAGHRDLQGLSFSFIPVTSLLVSNPAGRLPRPFIDSSRRRAVEPVLHSQLQRIQATDRNADTSHLYFS